MSEKIILKIIDSEERSEFEKIHALNILRLKNTCFEIPIDSPIEIINNDFKRKSTKKNTKDKTTK